VTSRAQREAEPLTKICARCRTETWIELFRILSQGQRASMCEDCERAYDRERKGGVSPSAHGASRSATLSQNVRTGLGVRT
jgi:hypothetical protein